MTASRSFQQWLQSVPRVHSETGVQQVKGRWMAATPDNLLHLFEEQGEVSEVGERIISLVDGRRTVAQIAAVLQSEFDVAQRQCEQQTVQFIETLIQKKVLALG